MPPRTRICYAVAWLVILALGAFILVQSARAHDKGIAEGIPEFVVGAAGCCGEHDCFELPNENVSQVKGGYLVIPPPESFDATPSFIEDQRVKDSQNGKWWGCFNRAQHNCLQWKSAGGYAICERKNPRPTPWTIRCFWRTVNA